MNRTFHKRFSVQGCIMVALPAAMSFWCFWMHTGYSPLLGFVLLLMVTNAVERLIHTTYTFTADGHLVVCCGRLSKAKTIALADIIGVHKVRGRLLVASHMIVEYGAGHVISVQPDNEKAFAEELDRRLDNIDKTSN